MCAREVLPCRYVHLGTDHCAVKKKHSTIGCNSICRDRFPCHPLSSYVATTHGYAYGCIDSWHRCLLVPHCQPLVAYAMQLRALCHVRDCASYMMLRRASAKLFTYMPAHHKTNRHMPADPSLTNVIASQALLKRATYARSEVQWIFLKQKTLPTS